MIRSLIYLKIKFNKELLFENFTKKGLNSCMYLQYCNVQKISFVVVCISRVAVG